MTPQEAALDLAAAFCLSAVIGFERQWRNRLAGLRTNTLVALGAATFVVFAQLYPEESSPTRVAAQVVSGIGFLGAGLIFREGLSVRGLNTAATLWCSAAIGVLAGAGFPLYAAIATGFVVFVNLLLRPIVNFINRQPLTGTELEVGYLLCVTCRSPDEAHIRALLLQGLAGGALSLRRLDSTDLEGGGAGRGDGIRHRDAAGRYRCREDRRPAQPRADGIGGTLAGRYAHRGRRPCGRGAAAARRAVAGAGRTLNAAAPRGSQIARDRLEFAHRRPSGLAGGLERALEAMADVIVNERLLGALDRALDRLELLCHLRARLAALDHLDDLLQVPVGALETLDDLGMFVVVHRGLLSSGEDTTYPGGRMR